MWQFLYFPLQLRRGINYSTLTEKTDSYSAADGTSAYMQKGRERKPARIEGHPGLNRAEMSISQVVRLL